MQDRERVEIGQGGNGKAIGAKVLLSEPAVVTAGLPRDIAYIDAIRVYKMPCGNPPLTRGGSDNLLDARETRVLFLQQSLICDTR